MSKTNAYFFEKLSPIELNRSIDLNSLGYIRIIFYLLALTYYFLIKPEIFQVEDLALIDPSLWLPVGFFKIFNIKTLSYESLHFLKYLWMGSLFFSALGLFSRTSTLLSAILGFYLIGLFGNFGQIPVREGLFEMALIMFALLPSGKKHSLDARFFETGVSKEYSSWPLQILQTYFFLSYFIAGVSKLFYTHGDYFLTDFLLGFLKWYGTDAGLALAQYPTICKISGALVILLEILCILPLFFRRTIFPLLIGLSFMHLMIELTMQLNFYPQYIVFLIFFIKQNSSKTKIIKKRLKKASIYVCFVMFFSTALLEPLMWNFLWPFSHMAFYTFRSPSDKFNISTVQIIFEDGSKKVLWRNKDTKPLERHVLLWWLGQVMEKDLSELDKALHHLIQKENTSSVNQGKKAIAIIYGHNSYDIETPRFAPYNPDRFKVLRKVCIEEYKDLCK